MYLKFNDFKRINQHFAHWPNRNIYTIFHTFWPQQKFTDNSFDVLKWVSVECIDAWCCKPNDFIYSFFPINNNMNSLGARKESYKVQVESGRLGFNCIATINISGSQAAKLLALCIENIPLRVNTFLYQQSFFRAPVSMEIYHLISSSFKEGPHSWGLAPHARRFFDDWDHLVLGNSSGVAE